MKTFMIGDYNEYDHLRLTVKKDKVDEVVSSYNAFLFEEVERGEDKRYSDVFHLDLKRPHKIPNKDKLQYLQVQYEWAINKRAKAESEKHYKSQSILSIAITLSVLAVFSVLALVFFVKTLSHIFLGVGMVVVELLSSTLLFYMFKKQRKKENDYFNEYLKEYNYTIDEIFAKVKELTKRGDNCEKI